MKTAGAHLPVVSASGSRLKLADGRELVDGIASWWTAAHGYRHPHIEAAVERQLKTLPHVMLGGLAHEQAYRLATRLAALLPDDLDHVFFSESGSVAVEIAMKMAVQYWLNQGERRTRFLSFTGGYHGDTLATMSVCDPDEGMHGMFRGVVPDQFVDDLTPDSVAAALEKHGAEIAAVLVEPLVQGAGGMRFHEAEMLRHPRAACDRQIGRAHVPTPFTSPVFSRSRAGTVWCQGDAAEMMGVCGQDVGMRVMCRGVVSEQCVVDLTPEAVDAALVKRGAEIAVVLVGALVQGAGGMLFHDAQMLRHLGAACDR